MKFDTLYKIMVNEAMDMTEDVPLDGEGDLGSDDGLDTELGAVEGFDPAELMEAQEVLGISEHDPDDLDALNAFELKAYATIALEKGYIARIRSGDMSADEALAQIEDTDYPKYKLSYKETKGGFTGIKNAEPVKSDRMSPDEARGLGASPEFDENPFEAGFEN